jgi:WD40 repeat protein
MAMAIQGVPSSWDQNIADTRLPGWICATAWSPCSRFIAAAYDESSEIVILDPVTLEQLNTLHSPQAMSWSGITFSPGSHLLTAYAWGEDHIISWDLQTGGLLSNISTEECCSIVIYSESERMIGGLFDNTTITIYNVFSGKCITSHSIEDSIVETIWSHGEYLQFATLESESIIIWQVSFTLSHSPTKVGSLSIPDHFSSDKLVMLPTLFRLAFILSEEIWVWDVQHHKVLLHSADVKEPRDISFSPDGHFFVCGTGSREFYIWKESPTGYLSKQQFVSGANGTRPLVSPNGGSVISSSDNTLLLWHTTGSPISIPRIIRERSWQGTWFYIEFSPDESLVAVTEQSSSIITVLETRSGNPWLVIDTGSKTCGLKITEDKIIVVGDKKIVTWDLPTKACVPNARQNINDSIQITVFIHSLPSNRLHASISPNLDYVAFIEGNGTLPDRFIDIYNLHTGEKLAAADSGGTKLGFTPSGHEVWCTTSTGEIGQWEIVKEKGSNAIKLKEIERNMEPVSGFPWLSSHGHQVTRDGWIICSSGKRLLMLPRHMQQDTIVERKWGEKCLAVWNRSSVRPCILKLEV